MTAAFSLIRAEQNALPESLIQGLDRLLCLHREALVDDFTESLLHNTLSCIPYVWLLVDAQKRVLAVACLTDVKPQATACIHGASLPEMRRQPVLRDAMIREVLRYAFEELGLHKLKAVFDADNRGALGFCRKWNFQREACLREETLRNGQRQDVLSYALFAERYLAQL